jgi:hypothetical protein
VTAAPSFSFGDLVSYLNFAAMGSADTDTIASRSSPDFMVACSWRNEYQPPR